MNTPESFRRIAEVAPRIEAARGLLLGLDFDGTLTPIRPRPGDVVLGESTREVLESLARRPRVTLMIVSGRALADVSDRLALRSPYYCAGNHGMEIRGPGVAFDEPTALALSVELRDLDDALQASLAVIPGALLERKGLTTSVHDRNVAEGDRGAVAEAVRRALATASDRFELTTGQRVWEIRPRVAWHKGKALTWVLERLGGPERLLPIYVGDDRTDEDAFACIPDGITVKVGVEASPTAARYRLDDPAAVERFLRWLDAACAQHPREG